MTRPTEFPRWSPNEGDTSKFVEPPEALKDAGYSPSQRPPAQYFNWQFARQGDWIAHFDRARVAEVLAEMGATPWSLTNPGTTPALRVIGESLAPSVAGANVTLRTGVALWFDSTSGPITYVAESEEVLAGASNAGGGSARVDIVTIVVSAVETTTASTSATIAIVQGTVGAGTPATPAGQVKIAEVTMQAGQTTYDAATLVDTRVLYTAAGGIQNLAPPASVTFSGTASGNYTFFQDATTLGELRGRGVQLADEGSTAAGYLRFREGAQNRYADITLPSGWNAAASGDSVVNVPPQSVLAAIAAGVGAVSPGLEMGALAFGSWTPVIPAGSKNYVVQLGFWARIGNMLFASWHCQYNTGSGITAVTFSGLPFSESGTIRGATGPTGAPGGQAVDATALTRFWARLNGSTVEILSDGHAAPGGGIAGNYKGAIFGFVG